MTVNPASAAPTLSTLTVNPASVVGGAGSTGTVTLTSAAPAGGAVVTLSSSNTTVAGVPASVTVAAGATSANFSITTTGVTAATSVTVGGSFGGVSKTATLTVNPPAPPAQTATLSVTATGRSGERVSSSPAGISVAVGSTGSATFNTGTSITLSATNGRDVDLVGCMLERRQQGEDLHVHHPGQRVGHRQREVVARESIARFGTSECCDDVPGLGVRSTR